MILLKLLIDRADMADIISSMAMKTVRIFLITLLFLPMVLNSQVPGMGDTAVLDSRTESSGDTAIRQLPRGYRNLLLGMPIEQVKTALIAESRFDYRGEPDVSLQDMGSRLLITCKGRGFIDEGFFHFNNELLYLITITFDQEKIDYFTLQQDLINKYGQPGNISPDGTVWEDETVIMTLEYPLTLKYLDKKTFEGFIDDAIAQKGFTEISRSEFLKDF